jgi:hypothetical protein
MHWKKVGPILVSALLIIVITIAIVWSYPRARVILHDWEYLSPSDPPPAR